MNRADVLDTFIPLTHGRLTQRQIQQRSGLDDNTTTRHLNRLKSSGMVRIAGRRYLLNGKARARVYEAQRTPFALPDTPEIDA